MTFLRNKLHMSLSSGSLVIVIKPITAVVLIILILQTDFMNECCMYSEELSLHGFLGP